MTEELKFISLDSVGSVLEMPTEIIYPMMEDGTPDLEMGTDLEDVSEEWWTGLSREDWNAILEGSGVDSFLHDLVLYLC